MSINLLDSVKGLFGNDLISRASSMFGESEGGVQKAVSAIIPSVLTGVLNKAGSGEAGGLLSMAKNAYSTGMLGNIGNFFGNSNLLSKGADMLKGLFGEHTAEVSNAVSNFAGIKPTTASSLMNVAVPATLGTIGKHASETNMNTNGLLSFLNGQKDNILNALPSGLNLAGALGISSLSGIGNKLSGALSGITGGVKEIPRYADRKTSGSRWVLPVILIAAVVGLLWYFLSGRKTPPVAKIEENVVAIDSTIAAPVVAQTIKVRLPDGTMLDARPGGIEDQLVAFLNDPSKKVDKDVWFDFDNLNFETGSAMITPESMPQVQNIVAIMKAFPNAAIKIGGYTDRTGDSVSNLKLSQSRADAVVAELKNRETSASQLAGAEGYGSQFAKAPADAPDEDRKKDRRIAVSVRKK